MDGDDKDEDEREDSSIPDRESVGFPSYTITAPLSINYCWGRGLAQEFS